MKAMVILQVICALGLINVWILRNQKSTKYRGGDSKNLKEERRSLGEQQLLRKLINLCGMDVIQRHCLGSEK